MHVVICSSIDFTPEIKQVALQLEAMGHTVDIPLTSQKIIDGELTMEEYLEEKRGPGECAQRKIKDEVIKLYFNKISNADAVLVLNFEKKGIPNYIGGNTFLEMGFAHVLNKDLFIFNDIPNMIYTDELLAIKPMVIYGELSVFEDWGRKRDS